MVKTSSLEPQPRRGRLPQVRFAASPSSLAYLRAVSKRTGLRQWEVLDRLVSEAQKLEREVTKEGFQHVGELIAVFREMRRAR